MSYILCLSGGMLFFRSLGFSVDDSFRWSVVIVFAARDLTELVFSSNLRAMDSNKQG